MGLGSLMQAVSMKGVVSDWLKGMGGSLRK